MAEVLQQICDKATWTCEKPTNF